VAEFLRDGLWIPLVLFLAALAYGAWSAYQVLDRLRSRRGLEPGLGDLLLQARVAQVRMEEAAALVEQGLVAQGLEALKELLRTNPGLPALHYFLGKAHRAAGDVDDARTHLEAYLQQARPYDRLSADRMEEARALLAELR
jgi:Flp pilus assembly protein TadD